jgi:hypothetical protein
LFWALVCAASCLGVPELVSLEPQASKNKKLLHRKGVAIHLITVYLPVYTIYFTEISQ